MGKSFLLWALLVQEQPALQDRQARKDHKAPQVRLALQDRPEQTQLFQDQQALPVRPDLQAHLGQPARPELRVQPARLDHKARLALRDRLARQVLIQR